ncbi:SsgA family sporulation/cell division regulator [Kitasatospora kazusensis]
MSAVRPITVTFPDSSLPDVPVDVELRFDVGLPYAACLAFLLSPADSEADRPELCWYFSRDLLNEGRHGPVGEGDVRVRPGAAGAVLITLHGLDGRVVLSAPQDAVAAFLADSFALVPAGSESGRLDIDTALARLRGTSS